MMEYSEISSKDNSGDKYSTSEEAKRGLHSTDVNMKEYYNKWWLKSFSVHNEEVRGNKRMVLNRF